jgi:hypothetical protein
MRPTLIIACAVFLSAAANAAPKAHIVALGKWSAISWRAEDGEGQVVTLKMRPLYVDGRTKEFTTGAAHDVTERTFVIQRIYRLNDSLPQESGPTQWRWQLGGWLLVDRVNGKVQQIVLTEFDPDSSAVNWFRDYAAYCGMSDDGQKVFAVIVQLGHRKPLLSKAVAEAEDSAHLCSAPMWERHPLRATFELKPEQKLTFAVKRRAVETITEDRDDNGSE